LPERPDFIAEKTVAEFIDLEAVGDHLADVQTVFQHGDHLVPGLEDLAAVDTLDGDGLEDDPAPVDRDFARRDAQHGDAAAHDHRLDHLVKRLLIA
jgi:hypothetical protein